MSQAGEIDVVQNHPEIPTKFIANVGTAAPIGNTIELLGEVIAAGSVPFQSVASGNTVTYQVQTTQAIAATDDTALGLAAFNSDDFIVDSNGFVSLNGDLGIQTINGNTGSITGTTVTIFTNPDLLGGTWRFVNADSTSVLMIDDDNGNMVLGNSSWSIGATTASSNTGYGRSCMVGITSGFTNLGIGNSTLVNITTGDFNCAFGTNSGGDLSSDDSSNLCIGNNGVSGDNNVLRIGRQGTGNLEQNQCYIAGIAGVSVSNTQLATIDSTTGQMGSTLTPSVTSITLSSGNALSNYVEGTWTPGISFGGGTTGITYAQQSGFYTRIGNQVFCRFFVALSNKGSSTGSAKITGLPITANSNANILAFKLGVTSNLTFTTLNTSAGCQGDVSATTLRLFQEGPATNNSDLTDTNFANNTAFIGEFFYAV